MRAVKYTLITLLVCVISGVIFAVTYVFSIDEWQSFEPRSVEGMERTLELYDANGELYARLYGNERRDYTPLSEIPKSVINAFLATEDARFYEHGGIDLIRIGGALLADIRSGSAAQGASTISQQLVKLSALTNERTVERKVTEIMMVFRLERAYSKDEILEMYLNKVYFGAGAHGIGTAARIYFSKECGELTTGEAAMLAGIVKAPSKFAPDKSVVKALSRRDVVLEAMAEQGFISEAEAAAAKSEKIRLSMSALSEYPYGWYTDMALSEAEDILGVSAGELLSGGYRIYTTLDAALQERSELLAADDAAFPADATDGTPVETAMIAIDPGSGAVGMVIGGREHTARRVFNRATAGKRQPGSAIKPVLVYAPALESGKYTAATVVADEPLEIAGWSPENSGGGYLGSITLREALAFSRNTPAVRVLADTGIDASFEYAKSVGIELSEGDRTLALALGGIEGGVSPKQLAASYAPFANGGFYARPYCIGEIRDRDGKVVYSRAPSRTRVLSEETAFIISSMLSSCAEYGTARALGSDSLPLCAKTGTAAFGQTGGNKDAWVVAYTGELVVACRMGFDDTDATHCLAAGDTGGGYPARLVKRVFEYVYSGADVPVIARPEGVVEVRLDKRALARGELVRAGLFADASKYVLEYFDADTAPKSARMNAMSEAAGFAVLAGDDGYPSVSFSTVSADAKYIIIRRNTRTGVTTELKTFEHAAARTYFTDYAAAPGETYEYSVQTVVYLRGVRFDGARTDALSVAVEAGG